MKKIFLIIVSCLLLLACGGLAPQATPPTGFIPIKQEAADQLKQNLYQSLAEAENNREATLRITNEEITSLIALELTQTGQIPITQPQVWFTPDKIHLTGLMSGVAPVDMQIYLLSSAYVSEGRVVVQIDEANMGQFSLPESTVTTLTDTINEALLESADTLEVTAIQINEGEMVVSGKKVD